MKYGQDKKIFQTQRYRFVLFARILFTYFSTKRIHALFRKHIDESKLAKVLTKPLTKTNNNHIRYMEQMSILINCLMNFEVITAQNTQSRIIINTKRTIGILNKKEVETITSNDIELGTYMIKYLQQMTRMARKSRKFT